MGSNVLGAKVSVLKQKMELLGINSHDFLIPGRFHHFFCPKVSPPFYYFVNLSLHLLIKLFPFFFWLKYFST